MIEDDDEKSYLIKMDNNLVNKEKINIDDVTFDKVMFLYNSALKEIKTKIDILQDELKLFHNYEPIEYITTRIKKPENIIEKMERKKYELTYENMFDKINDIAGIRVVCNFKKDVYRLVEIIEEFPDIRIINKKDFMKNPKKSGYMSYHIIIEVPVTFSSGTMFVKVEIQIRTLGMDFWASIEHKLKYKNPNINKGDSKNLVKYARIINNIDDNILTISNRLEKERIKNNIMIEAADSKKDIEPNKFNFKL